MWLSQHFRFERPARRALLVHLPVAALFSLGHIALITAVQLVARVVGRPHVRLGPEFEQAALTYLDWEMMTYWAIAGAQSRRPLLPRVARPRRSARRSSRRSSIEARMATLQQQLQPHFLFNTLHAISR